MRMIGGIGAIADAYDGFVLDLWGCIHDGVEAFPAAIDALARLRAAGKRAVLLSNAPRRVDAVIAQLRHLGVPDDSYAGVMSSGEATWRHLATRDDPWFAALGRRCLHVGPARDHGMLEGAALDPVDGPANADFLLVTGPYGSEDAADACDGLLAVARDRGLPMVCANPDLIVVRGRRSEICAGSIAARYEAMGGTVRRYGKPDPKIYQDCFRLLDRPAPRRVLAVGDSLATDIKGANAAGIDSLLLTRGIHEAELNDAAGDPDPARIAAAAMRMAAHPTFVAARLQW